MVGLDKLPDQLLEADIVVSSTSSPHPIVGSEELALVMEQRTGRPTLHETSPCRGISIRAAPTSTA